MAKNLSPNDLGGDIVHSSPSFVNEAQCPDEGNCTSHREWIGRP